MDFLQAIVGAKILKGADGLYIYQNSQITPKVFLLESMLSSSYLFYHMVGELIQPYVGDMRHL